MVIGMVLEMSMMGDIMTIIIYETYLKEKRTLRI